MAATIRRATVRASWGGIEPAQMMFKEGDSQSFKDGAVVILTAGKVVEAAADPVKILGLACCAGNNNTAAKEMGVEIAGPDSRVEMNIGGGGNATIANVGVSYGLVKDATGHWCVDLTEVTVKTVTIVRLVDPSGTVSGRVECAWVVGACQLFRAN